MFSEFLMVLNFIFIFCSQIFLFFILFSIIRRFYINHFDPQNNFDKYFLKDCIEKQNMSFIIIKITNSNYEEFINFKTWIINQIKLLLENQNGELETIDFQSKKKPKFKMTKITIEDIISKNDLNDLIKSLKSPIFLKFNEDDFTTFLLLSHAIFDGINIIKKIICPIKGQCNQISKLPSLPKYIPIISEINLTKTLGRIISLPKNSLPLLDESPNLLPESNYLKLNLLLKDILSEKKKLEKKYPNQKFNFLVFPLAIVLYLLKKFIDKNYLEQINKTYFTICVLGAFDNNNTNNKNSFAFIPICHKISEITSIDIEKLKFSNLYNVILNLNNNLEKCKSDLVGTYDILNYFLSLYNDDDQSSKFDINYSSLKIPDLNKNLEVSNSQVMLYKNSNPIYVCSATNKDKIDLSFSINTSKIYCSKFKKQYENYLFKF